MSTLNLNHLFVKWLEDQFEELNKKGSKVAYAYTKALDKIKAFPEPITTPKQLNGIQYVGAKLVKFLCARLKKHCKENSVPVPVEFENYVGGTEGGKRLHEIETTEPSKKAKASNWVPKRRGGLWAILLTLYTIDRTRRGLRKEDIIATAEKYCDKSFTANPAARDYYSAWDGIKTLLKRGLVEEFGRPKAYFITEEGIHMASVLLHQEGIQSSPEKPPDVSFDNGLRVSPESSVYNSLAPFLPDPTSSPLNRKNTSFAERFGSLHENANNAEIDQTLAPRSQPPVILDDDDLEEMASQEFPMELTGFVDEKPQVLPEPLFVDEDVDQDQDLPPIAFREPRLWNHASVGEMPPPRSSQSPPKHLQNPLRFSQTPVRLSQNPVRLSQTPPKYSQTPPRLSQTPPKYSQTPPTLSLVPPVTKKPVRANPVHVRQSTTNSFHVQNPTKPSGLGYHDAANKVYLGTPYDVWTPEDYTVVLLLDNREIRSQTERDFFYKKIAAKGVACDVRALSVGDVLWVARHKKTKKEVVLNYICERKRIDDLACSIKDGRFAEQKSRLKKSGIKNIHYLVEEAGLLDVQRIVDMKASIETAISMVITVLNFCMQRFRRIDDTTEWLVAMSELLQKKYLGVRLLVLKPHLVYTQDDYFLLLQGFRAKFETRKTPYECVHSYALFQDTLVKTKMMTVKEMFIKMLMLVRGVSFEKAIMLQRHFQTPRGLIEFYIENQHLSEQEKGMLISKKFQDEPGPRKFTKPSLVAMYEAWGKAVC